MTGQTLQPSLGSTLIAMGGCTPLLLTKLAYGTGLVILAGFILAVQIRFGFMCKIKMIGYYTVKVLNPLGGSIVKIKQNGFLSGHRACALEILLNLNNYKPHLNIS